MLRKAYYGTPFSLSLYSNNNHNPMNHEENDLMDAVMLAETEQYVALNFAGLDHRKNVVIEIIAAYPEFNVRYTLDDTKDQHAIVTSQDFFLLMEMLKDVDPMTIVWDDTLALEYYSELS